MPESSLTTVIYVISAIVGTIAAIFGLIAIFRPDIFSRPELKLDVGWGRRPDDLPKKHKNLPVRHLVFAPTKQIETPLVVFVMFAVRNRSRQPLRNVRVLLEYGDQYVIKNQMFKSIAKFGPAVVDELSNSETATVIRSALTDDDIKRIIDQRQVTVFSDRAQMALEEPILRPNESLYMYDLVWLPGRGADDIQKLGFGADGYKNVLNETRKIKGLLDHFVINIIAFAENHKGTSSKVSVLRFTSEKDVEAGLKQYGESFWFGHLPKPGVYFDNPIKRFIKRKRNQIGRQGREMRRDELGLITYSRSAEVTVPSESGHGKIEKLVLEVPDHSAVEYFVLFLPNCDYFNLPPWVKSFETLMKWLGFAPYATVSRS
jgi:hypothetical protein